MTRRFLIFCVSILLLSRAALALEPIEFAVSGDDEALQRKLIDASLLVQAKRDDVTDPQAIMADARSDYARLVGVLYEEGYFGPVVSILIDGTEAATISPLSDPASITRVRINVTPGPSYRFGALEVEPLAPGTTLPEGFARGETAQTGIIGAAARSAVRGWEDIGYAKAELSDQKIVADHRNDTVSADLTVAPGPELRFGTLTIVGNEEVRSSRMVQIADFPTGELYSPKAVNDVAENVRRTGTFKSVVMAEADTPNANGTLDMTMTVSEQLPRRFGFGAEYSTNDGVELQGYWLHRNLLGGAERLELNATVTGLASEFRNPGLEFSARLTRPASPRSDMDFFILAELGILDERDYSGENLKLGFGWQKRFSDRLNGEIGFAANASRIDDDWGESQYRLVSAPMRLTYDKRNDFISPTKGYYIDGQLEPFLNIKGTSNGARFYGDLRGYRSVAQDKLVLAGRLQMGSIVGPELLDTPNYMLFYSGGGGTVRGQEYESLGVTFPNGNRTGGRSYLGTSFELRGQVSSNIELVGFYDWGYIGPESFYDGSGESQSGAGVGVRYITPIGPLRVDIGVPVTGPDTGSQFLLYIGIGQAF